MPSSFGDFNLLDSAEDGGEDEVDFPDSDEEEEDEDTALLRQEVTPPRSVYLVLYFRHSQLVPPNLY